MAKAYFMVADSDTPGMDMDFDDGHVSYSVNLGYPNINLIVGPCKYCSIAS